MFDRRVFSASKLKEKCRFMQTHSFKKQTRCRRTVRQILTGGTFIASNYSITYINGDIIVESPVAILTSGTLPSLNTAYGTASASTSFTA